MPQYGKLKIDQFLYNDSGTDVTLDLANIASRGANTFTGSQSLGDNLKVQFGAGNDLQIYHNGTNSIIDNNTGDLTIRADGDDLKLLAEDDIVLRDNDDSTNFIHCVNGGAVDLYYDGSKKFATVNTGVEVFGDIFGSGKVDLPDNGKLMLGTGDDLQIYHDGSNSFIKNSTGNLRIQDDDGNIQIQAKAGEESIIAKSDAAVELYYDGSKKAETVATGFLISGELVTSKNAYSRITHQESGASKWSCGLRANGDDDYHLYREAGSGNVVIDNGNLNLGDSQNIHIGDSNDLILRHDGSHSYITNATGTLHIMGKSGENSIQAQPDGAVELYYDNSKKLQTQSWGVQFYGTLHAVDSAHINLGASNDLQIYHDGSNSKIDSSTGFLGINSNGGSLYLDGAGGGVYLRAGASGSEENALRAIPNGAVELYYDNSKKLETTSSGINVTGAITVNGAALAGGSSYAGLLKYF